MGDGTAAIDLKVKNNEVAIKTKSIDLESKIMALVIKNADDMRMAVELKAANTGVEKAIEALCNPNIKKADQLHTDLIAQRDTMLAPCVQNKKVLDYKATEYNNDLEALREAEQKQLQKLADKEQERLQKLAIAKTDKLLGGISDLGEQLKKLQGALLEQATDFEHLNIQSRIMSIQRQIDTKQDKIDSVEANKSIAPPAIVSIAPTPEKIKGVRMTTKKVPDMDTIDIVKLVKAAAANSGFLFLLKVNETALKGFIKQGQNVDGVTVITESKTRL